jgi:hypothetical protein
MSRDLKEDFFRLDGAWASFELMSIRRRDDYLKPFRVLRCKIDDQVDFQAPETLRSATEATVLIEIFGEEELVAASGRGPVQAVDNAVRKILEKHYPQLSEVTFDCCIMVPSSGMTKTKAPARWLECWLFFPMAPTDGALWAWLQISFRPASNASLTVSSGNFAANTSTRIKRLRQESPAKYKP